VKSLTGSNSLRAEMLMRWNPAADGMPLEQLIASFGEFIPFIHTKLDVVLYNAFPFNLLKGLVISGVTMLVYKRLSPVLKGAV
jgi:riboflavin transporter FmnP